MHGVPRLEISRDPPPEGPHDPSRSYPLRYAARHHPELPHVVKFSGGRSSGMMLFTMLENGLLSRERGDVVVFNNTSCEHPETYRFVARCKEETERVGIPFFMVEFTTYEDARRGEWSRIPSHRLVNERPRSEENPEGFHWRGEVFEEAVSQKAFLPNRFRRTCTTALKLETTRGFLQDWLGGGEGLRALGHGQAGSQVNIQRMHRRHLQDGGSIPPETFREKKAFMLARPANRPEQRYRDFSPAARPVQNAALAGGVFGGRAKLEDGGAGCMALIGLRADEQFRVHRVKARAQNPHARAGYEGEHVMMPLDAMGITRRDVTAFWEIQEWDLGLPAAEPLSNCTFCFLKGTKNLLRVRDLLNAGLGEEIPGFGDPAGTPLDIRWWERMEERYGRDLDLESGGRRNPEGSGRIGFLGAGGPAYGKLALMERQEDGEFPDLLPCDCTE